MEISEMNRLRWRCTHRALLEMDLLLGNFLDTQFSNLSAEQVAARRDLMTSDAALNVLRENSLRFFPDVPTVPMLIWHGSLTVLGQESNKMISGIAGLGHMLITAGMIVFFVALRRAVLRSKTPTAELA